MASTSDFRSLHTHIGKAIHFKGEISGGEDIYIDGNVEGTINLANQAVTVGPHGRVIADLSIREITIQGKLQGQIIAQERIEITQTGSVIGEVTAARVAVHDGASFKGKLEVVRPREEVRTVPVATEPVPVAAEPVPAPTPARASAVSAAASAASTSAASPGDDDAEAPESAPRPLTPPRS